MSDQSRELEDLASALRKRAGASVEGQVLATQLAFELLGPCGLVFNERLRGAILRRTDLGYQIVVNPNHHDVRFHVAHEIGEWALKVVAPFSGPHEERERCANYIAAALLAPATAVRRMADFVGITAAEEERRLSAIATHFAISKTSAVIRVAEVTGEPRVVVTRRDNVLVQVDGRLRAVDASASADRTWRDLVSDGEEQWIQIPVVRLAKSPGSWRGLAKARLRGGIDAGRVALRAKRA